MFYYLLLTIPLMVITGLYYRKRKSLKPASRDTMETEKVVAKEKKEIGIQPQKETQEKHRPERIFRTAHDIKKQTIHLLSDFQVKDKNGEDITRLFTPTLKSLLLLLITHTEENPDGISGNRIVEVLWSKKNKYAARNNRNVSLTKLRHILDKVGHTEILNQGNYWKIIFSEEVLCDYSEINSYYQAIKEGDFTDTDHSRLHILLDLLYRGPLLYRFNKEWLDPYKIRFSNQTTRFLMGLLNNPEIKGHQLRLKIANTLLQHDYLNEQALQTQCVILYKESEKQQMRDCYEKFCTNYANLLGIPYTKTLTNILKEGNGER